MKDTELSLLRAALDAASDPIAITCDRGLVVWANEAYAATQGQVREKIVGCPLQARPSSERRAIELREGDRDVTYWIEVYRAPAAGSLGGASVRDVVERIREPIVATRRGKGVDANAACAKLLGYTREEIIGRPTIDFVHPDDRAYVTERLRALSENTFSQPTREHRLVRSDGRIIPVTVYSLPALYDGQLTALSFINDLSERKSLEAQLMTADRLASIGRLAAAIGHEINNPLAYTLATVESLHRELDDVSQEAMVERGPRLRSMVSSIREGSDRVREIVRDLKMLGGDSEDSRGPVDVHQCIESSLRMASHEIRHRARITRCFGEIPYAFANEARLGQVFLNLLVNAGQAIEVGSRDENEVSVTTYVDSEARIVVEIADTGAGLDRAVADRMFEPFFTTKPRGVGTGLGLSISHHIVTSLGGSIGLVPRAGRGTCIRVTLPAAPEATAPSVDPDRRTRAPVEPLRILVVDDEPALGRAISDLLDAHKVTVACSGSTAIEHLVDGSFDVILCDLHLGDSSGIDLYEHVRARHPALERRMIFMTGGAFSERTRAFLAESPRPHVDKPFDLHRLESLLAEVTSDPD